MGGNIFKNVIIHPNLEYPTTLPQNSKLLWTSDLLGRGGGGVRCNLEFFEDLKSEIT